MQAGPEQPPLPGRSLCPAVAQRPPSRASPLTGAAVLPGEQVVGERRRVGQALQRRVEEARVAQVEQPGADRVVPLPVHREALPGAKLAVGHGDPAPLRPWVLVVACGVKGGEQRGVGCGEGPRACLLGSSWSGPQWLQAAWVQGLSMVDLPGSCCSWQELVPLVGSKCILCSSAFLAGVAVSSLSSLTCHRRAFDADFSSSLLDVAEDDGCGCGERVAS